MQTIWNLIKLKPGLEAFYIIQPGNRYGLFTHATKNSKAEPNNKSLSEK